jgi:hypothetical protein
MDAIKVPTCPQCPDGGNVKLIKITDEADAVFEPMPEGWDETVYVFQCTCGWSMGLDRWPEGVSPRRVRRSA